MAEMAKVVTLELPLSLTRLSGWKAPPDLDRPSIAEGEAWMVSLKPAPLIYLGTGLFSEDPKRWLGDKFDDML